ncbi:MAG: hypothetical protein LCH81_12245 [Bacteroidetes bacterium]|nr:hypothetical protein [Bacteroidota bacterium]
MNWTLIPTTRLSFPTDLSKAEILRRVQEKLDSPENNTPRKEFDGVVEADGFEVWEVYRRSGGNSFSPMIKANIVETDMGNDIQIRLQMRGCVWAFLLVWCYPFALMLFMTLVLLFREGVGALDWSILLIIFMPAFMITLAVTGFRAGNRAANAFVQDILAGKHS